MDELGRFLAVIWSAVLLAAAPPAFAECVDAPDLAAYQTATRADFALGPTRSDHASSLCVAPSYSA